MLKRLHLRNFTVFADAEFEFGDGLNVLVGTNGTGKTHVLKAGYAAKIAQNDASSFLESAAAANMPDFELRDTTAWILSLRQALQDVFLLYEGIDSIVKRGAKKADINVSFDSFADKASFQIKSKDIISGQTGSIVMNSEGVPLTQAMGSPRFVLIPAKEVLTLGWLPAVYDRYQKGDIRIDRTYPDVIRLLLGPSLRHPEPAYVVENLVKLIGGKVEEDGGRFYLATPEQSRLEMNLVAEGMRKFATLYKLLANGTLTPETTLFWDEPEANLNPALLKEMAVILTDLGQAGFQIILATHSLFLMRELHILAQQKKKPVRYFGLYKGEEGDVRVERQDDLMQLQHITALDAELAQTFDFEAALDEEYAGDN
ncbi:AAA family ATPase [Hymenobacter bucti]|uniref:ATP/GTP-binding protein n=1 Tax=Hymenobacter bucti TaxID=1844114 RepID=A0ABW4R0H5_9BACT